MSNDIIIAQNCSEWLNVRHMQILLLTATAIPQSNGTWIVRNDGSLKESKWSFQWFLLKSPNSSETQTKSSLARCSRSQHAKTSRFPIRQLALSD